VRFSNGHRSLYIKIPVPEIDCLFIAIFRNTNPNNISWFLLVVGFLMLSPVGWVFLPSGLVLLLTVLLGFVRMVVATLDGLVAVEFNKSTVLGDVVNRMTTEICDLVLYPVLVIALGI